MLTSEQGCIMIMRPEKTIENVNTSYRISCKMKTVFSFIMKLIVTCSLSLFNIMLPVLLSLYLGALSLLHFVL